MIFFSYFQNIFSSFKTSFERFVILFKLSSNFLYSSFFNDFLIWENFKPISVKRAICVVKALVDATPISGPAWVKAPLSTSLAIDDPTTLHIRKQKLLLFCHFYSCKSIGCFS